MCRLDMGAHQFFGLLAVARMQRTQQSVVFLCRAGAAGGVIQGTDALLSGLHAGRPAAAGLDVFDIEPIPMTHPLLDADLISSGRLLLTPHLGYATEATMRLFYKQMTEAIRAWKAGAPVNEI